MAKKPPKKKEEGQIKFYTIKFEKFIELITENEMLCNMVAHKIKDIVADIHIDNWSNSPLDDFCEAYVLTERFKYFLEEKINNPTQDEIDFTTRNEIKDVLLTSEELQYMQATSTKIEDIRATLEIDHHFSTILN